MSKPCIAFQSAMAGIAFAYTGVLDLSWQLLILVTLKQLFYLRYSLLSNFTIFEFTQTLALYWPLIIRFVRHCCFCLEAILSFMWTRNHETVRDIILLHELNTCMVGYCYFFPSFFSLLKQRRFFRVLSISCTLSHS